MGVEARGSAVQGHPLLLSQLEASLGYIPLGPKPNQQPHSVEEETEAHHTVHGFRGRVGCSLCNTGRVEPTQPTPFSSCGVGSLLVSPRPSNWLAPTNPLPASHV